MGFCHGFATVGAFLVRFGRPDSVIYFDKWFKIKRAFTWAVSSAG
jgi:hypothetical protein